MRNTRPIIQPALMADEWELLVANIRKVAGFAHAVQLDVMDGILVPSRSFPYNQTILEGKEIPYNEEIAFEIHLMVDRPYTVGMQYIAAGARCIVAQIEGFGEEVAVRQTVDAWRAAGAARIGLSLMLDTPLDTVTSFLESKYVDYIQVMSIAKVGYQGETFDPRALIRIAEIRERFPNVTIGVDGGIGFDTIRSVVVSGADTMNVGSALLSAKDPKKQYTQLCLQMEK